MSKIIAVPCGNKIEILSESGASLRKFSAGGDILSGPIVAGNRIQCTVRTRSGNMVCIFSETGASINKFPC